MPTLIEANGGGPQKQPRYVPIFMDRTFTGLFTQRSVLHDPSDIITAKYYGGRPDALWMGKNIELTNRLTLQRRPGLSPFSTFNYPTPPLRSYSFQLTDGTIRVIVDTGDTGTLVLTSVAAPLGPFTLSAAANASAGTTAYTGTITGGGANALANQMFTVTGFVNALNNGTFLCTASSATTLTLANPVGVAESTAAVATDLSAVFTGTITGGANNAYAGLTFLVAGFTSVINNGTWTATGSTATTITMTAPASVAETHAATTISAGAVYWDEQNGSAQMLFAKSPGAGQTYFQGVGGILYMGDGVDTRKYTPLNPNTPPGSSVSVWNWGIEGPTNQPGVIATSSGSASTVWQANSFFTTMGLTVDTNATPQIWQLIGVNADGTNTPNAQFGTAGNGNPTWNQALYGTTTETSGTPIIWKNLGQISQWQGGFQYGDAGVAGTAAPVAIYDPTSSSIYLNFHGSGGLSLSGHSKPSFNGVAGSSFWDNQAHWFFFCTYTTAKPWKASTGYTAWYSSSHPVTDAAIEPFLLPPPTNQPIYLQVPTNTGTSGTNYAPFPPSAGIGTQQPDAQLNWLCLGQAAWQANHSYAPFTVFGSTFGCIKDQNGNMQVCLSSSGSGLSGATDPNSGTGWGTTYGAHTTDGSLVWVCVGPPTAWVAGTGTTGIWNLPPSGFQPPQASQAYGGSTIDSNTSLVETVIISGKSGTVQPTWGVIHTNTTDNTITWFGESAVNSNSLASTKGFSWGYSFKARAFDDFYSPLPLGGGAVPPASVPLGLPTGSATNAISTSSPANTLSGANAGAVYTVSGLGSTDPQVDTIVIWRSADGGGPAQMFELTEIPAPKPIGGVAQPWSFQDFLPSAPTSLYPGLNTEIPAPINSSNNPPFATFLPMAYNYQRIWGADGSDVPFSGGPDVETGNPNEAFAPADSLPFLAPVIRLVKTPQGLVTFLTDSVEVIAGGPLTSSFFSVTWAPGIGLLSYNMLDILAGEIYFFSADNQFRIMTPSLNIANAGFALGDQFANLPSSGISDATWDPKKGYVASHQNGIDNCVIIADGSTGWYRLNPRQAGAQQNPEPIWSPFAAITNGCKMVQSVETAPGIKSLLVGPSVLGEEILKRDLTVFTDDGTPYDAFFVMGSITLAHPGQLAVLKFMEFDFSGAPVGGPPPVGFRPTVSYLLNEISGSFTPFTTNPQFDPPSLYGTTTGPASYSPNRYYFLSNASLARCRHMQIKVDFGTTSNGDEIYNATIFGRLMIET